MYFSFFLTIVDDFGRFSLGSMEKNDASARNVNGCDVTFTKSTPFDETCTNTTPGLELAGVLHSNIDFDSQRAGAGMLLPKRHESAAVFRTYIPLTITE